MASSLFDERRWPKVASATLANAFKQPIIGRHSDGTNSARESHLDRRLEHSQPSKDLSRPRFQCAGVREKGVEVEG